MIKLPEIKENQMAIPIQKDIMVVVVQEQEAVAEMDLAKDWEQEAVMAQEADLEKGLETFTQTMAAPAPVAVAVAAPVPVA